ncbi:mediator of DNA damage checkpoint protein 1 isoform X2 [Trichosurus vulpecula]|uniref:mediator of DNA damage checkpoint protein 1 isoform X2 n=1 Tax=Trichosurus vulpecula TaxID=9337 RepID=UPI00186B09C4|nr:mediator of DNA damage checkpoint protein 1 isoform X2 [Trichosurus vulpecula]
MEDTQLVEWENQEEEPEGSNGSLPRFGLEPVGRLHLFSSVRGPEKDFLLYPGENVVGRIPGCTVALPFPSISKQHAVIEIPAQGRAPILRDCGSLNHTRLLRPPKLLSPGVGHQLRDQDLVLFADLPCQYHRLGDPPLPGPRGALSVEETPRVPEMGGPRFQGTLLAEDSEEEGDSPLDRSVKVSVTYSPSETVVSESDVEGASPGTKGSALPLTFILDSDTDEEEAPPPIEPSLAARRGSTVGTQHSSLEDSSTDLEEEGLSVRPANAHLEMCQPDMENSDTDIEEDAIPAAPPVVHLRKDQVSTVEASTLEKSAQEGIQNSIERGSDPVVEGTEDFQNKSDGTSDLDLPDTQCFVKGMNQNHGAHGACPSPPKTASDLQPGSPEKTEPSRSQGTENPNTENQGQTMKSDMENQVIETSRITPERKMEKKTFKKKTLASKAKRSKRKKVSPVVQTEIPERGQRCASSTGEQNVMTQKDVKSCRETKALEKEMERQTSEKDIFERQAPERKTKSLMVEGKVPRKRLGGEAGGQTLEDYDQEVQNPAPVPKSKVEEVDLQELASNPQILGDSRSQRGLDDSKSLPVEEVPTGDQDSSDIPLVASKVPVPEAPAPSSSPRITRSRNRRTSKPLHSSSSPTSQESPILRTRRSRRQGTLLAPNIEPLLPQDSRDKSESSFQSQTQKPFSPSSAPIAPGAPELRPPIPKDLPVIPKPCLQIRQSRKRGATRTCGSTTVVPDLPEPPTSIPTELSENPVPPPKALRSQRARVGEHSESLTATPEPSTPEASAPRATRNQRVGAVGTPVSTPEAKPKLSGQKRPLATKEPSPCPKKPRRGRSQRQESSKEEDEKPVEVETTMRTPVGVAELAVQAKEEVKGTPSRSLRRARLSRESRVPKVLFTGVVDAPGEQAVLALGGSLATSVAEASHLVTDRVRRTVKFLCALGRGIPILSLEWLHQSRKAGRFLPSDDFLVNDPEQEKNFGFSLREALSRAQDRGLLEGYEIYVTPGVQPPPPQMGEIITCCGGTALSSIPRAYKPQRFVIACPQDLSRCSAAIRAKLPLLSPEFLLTGVLRQEAQPEAFLLCTSES